MATDIFPEINIPVISIIWNYSGLPAQEMGQRIAAQNERSLTTTVSDIEHIESTSLAGITVIKVFFQPTANIQTAIAQVVAIEQTQVRQLPPGITPPLIIKYSASSIPVVQLGLSSADAARADGVRRRGQHAAAAARSRSPASRSRSRTAARTALISVDLDMQALQARGLAPADVVNAVNLQNLILPSGTAKFGDTEYTVRMNGSPEAIAGPERPAGAHERRRDDLPARRRLRARRLLAADQHRAPGRRARRAAVGAEERRRLDARHRRQPAGAAAARAAQLLPADVKITPLFDQSVFVKAAIKGVVAEALIAAGADRGDGAAVPRQLAQRR